MRMADWASAIFFHFRNTVEARLLHVRMAPDFIQRFRKTRANQKTLLWHKSGFSIDPPTPRTNGYCGQCDRRPLARQTCMTTRCLIYAHWDLNGFVDPYVIHALRQYRPTVQRIVFVSTHYQLRNRELDAVADDVIVRENIGFDFQSWKEGLEKVGLDTFDEFLFANSSVYGPVWPFERVLASPITRNAGIWGMTISQQHMLHLQSYFMAMPQHFLASEAGRELWGSVVPFRTKADCIEACELTWMERCLQSGLDVEAFFDARRFPAVPLGERLANMVRWPPRGDQRRRYRIATRQGPGNPTHLHWKQLLECGVPFVKCDLLMLNPCGIRLSRVYDWLEKHTSYPTELIRKHVARLRRQRAAA